ncbi:MAG: dimethyl sulfoxide reductase anchor subunit [Candidatus Solibacter usitatus]|nr:dimethyl sulfoxide reductase anchor subunit [Candidatus Solibacter usitatus]
MLAELPLLERSDLISTTLRVAAPLVPQRKPVEGEQYRFHFDMTKCIGCKCCVVACNEQNGNPAEINWRRVGEIEGGVFPLTQRWHLSMGCNHCLEPSCMTGCPVEAYTKDPLTGIVDHSADACIGCQYCTWNCSYGVPQFNESRGVVGKCDMCHGRLSAGLSPACVNACPEGAIAIEIVNMAAWRRQHDGANAPGLPSADDSFSTTRITLPANAIGDLNRVDTARVRPENPHWSLIFLLVLTQLAVGAMSIVWLLECFGAHLASTAPLLPLAVGLLSLAAAPIHLGRPIYAYRAVRGWKRSWLSREILTLSIFAAAAAAYSGALFFGLPYRLEFGALTVLAGLAGVTCSARIYMVPARPAWNMAHTLIEFLLTAAILGPALTVATGVSSEPWLVRVALFASALQVANAGLKYVRMSASQTHELRGSATLLAVVLRPWFVARILGLFAGGIALALGTPVVAFVIALASEIAGRYLFFTAVVPKGVASTFIAPGRRAA